MTVYQVKEIVDSPVIGMINTGELRGGGINP